MLELKNWRIKRVSVLSYFLVYLTLLYLEPSVRCLSHGLLESPLYAGDSALWWRRGDNGDDSS